MCVAIAFLLGGMKVYYWREYWKEAKCQLAIINGTQSERIIALSERYPEVNAYRCAVIQQRELTNGDALIMEKIAIERNQVARQNEAHNKQQSLFKAVHKVDLPTSG